MLLEELKNYYKNAFDFHNQTGMSHNSWPNWEIKGYIPIKTQLKIQRLTNFKFEADLEHTEE